MEPVSDSWYGPGNMLVHHGTGMLVLTDATTWRVLWRAYHTNMCVGNWEAHRRCSGEPFFGGSCLLHVYAQFLLQHPRFVRTALNARLRP